MKLIIDIDEEDFNLIRDNIKSYSLADVLFGAVKDGEPYEDRPQGDCISREALKKAFEKVYPLSTNEMGGVVNKRIYDIIDNAPSVKPCDNCDLYFKAMTKDETRKGGAE